jgi:ribA/ribD-fused uncharacterized protein
MYLFKGEKMSNNEKYEFFWSGPFSQWYSSKFTVNGITFATAEQFMMYSKAMLFNDQEIANKILLATNPKQQKALGRQVKNFNADRWSNVAKEIVYEGNYAKFTQDPKLLVILMATGDKELVEASPFDKIWGIGLDEAKAKVTPVDQWPGSNWLGEVLTELRNDLRNSKVEAV